MIVKGYCITCGENVDGKLIRDEKSGEMYIQCPNCGKKHKAK